MVGGSEHGSDICENVLPVESPSALLSLLVQNGPTQLSIETHGPEKQGHLLPLLDILTGTVAS